MRYGSLCSGIESTSVAWEPLGLRPAWFAENDPYCCAVLSARWPAVPNLGDITSNDFTSRARSLGAIDILVGGTPCQGFSLVGRRGGLYDPRSWLALSFLEATACLRPTWLFWENVPGVLTSNAGRDFGAILWQVGQLGYGWCYRVLDSQYFGVPQRRRRLYLVGHLGREPPASVLFEPEVCPYHHRPQQKRRPCPAPCNPRLPGDAGTRTVAFRVRPPHGKQMEMGGDLANALMALNHRGLAHPHVWHNGRLRRLTPREYERLQAFPDDYSDVPWPGGNETHRYRVVGNAMTVPVMRWLGQRLLAYAEHARSNPCPSPSGFPGSPSAPTVPVAGAATT
jgi:DNA (cytosine-5)-methyltransferase 1